MDKFLGFNKFTNEQYDTLKNEIFMEDISKVVDVF